MISIVYISVGIICVALAVVFSVIYNATKSFRKAFIAALIIFKISIIILAAYGVDKTLFYIKFVTKRGIVKIPINASGLALLMSFSLLITTIFSEYFIKSFNLPEELKKVIGVE